MLNLEYNCIQYIEPRLIKKYKSKIKGKRLTLKQYCRYLSYKRQKQFKVRLYTIKS